MSTSCYSPTSPQIGGGNEKEYDPDPLGTWRADKKELVRGCLFLDSHRVGCVCWYIDQAIDIDGMVVKYLDERHLKTVRESACDYVLFAYTIKYLFRRAMPERRDNPARYCQSIIPELLDTARKQMHRQENSGLAIPDTLDAAHAYLEDGKFQRAREGGGFMSREDEYIPQGWIICGSVEWKAPSLPVPDDIEKEVAALFKREEHVKHVVVVVEFRWVKPDGGGQHVKLVYLLAKERHGTRYRFACDCEVCNRARRNWADAFARSVRAETVQTFAPHIRGFLCAYLFRDIDAESLRMFVESACMCQVCAEVVYRGTVFEG